MRLRKQVKPPSNHMRRLLSSPILRRLFKLYVGTIFVSSLYAGPDGIENRGPVSSNHVASRVALEEAATATVADLQFQ